MSYAETLTTPFPIVAEPDDREQRKARGAFFTPEALTRYVVEWAVRTPEDLVLEPSCGEAAFLLEAGARLRTLGNMSPVLHGFDLHAPSVEQATSLLRQKGFTGRLQQADFFEIPAEPQFDAVVGNPPYVRYQSFTGAARERALNTAKRHGVDLTQLANIWAAFVVHAVQFMKPDGRLGLVLPAALMSVNYAEPVRCFLMKRFKSVRLVTFEERVFPGVQEEVVLLLAEGEGPSDGLQVSRFRDAEALKTPDSRPAIKVVFNDSGTKWTSALVRPGGESLDLSTLVEKASFETLHEWGDVELGAITGNNDYFGLTEAQVAELGLSPTDVVRVSPPGSKHLRGVIFSKRMLADLTKEGRKTYLFYPQGEPSEAAWKYIKAGEEKGVNNAYKCRNRTPWWRVPLVKVPDLIFTYMSGDAPRLVANGAEVTILNSVHGVRIRKERKSVATDLLPVAALNSLTLLGAELIGRSYGGGILKLEPREARRLPLPAYATLRKADTLEAAEVQTMHALRKADLDAVVARVDEALLVSAVGMPRQLVKEIRAAWKDLQQRRETRGKGSR